MSNTEKFISVALAGAPNAGKSTLLNAVLETKLSIVTPKVQTTRKVIRGVLTSDNIQVEFLDTPGLFNPKKPLERDIVAAAKQGLEDCDEVLFLIDSKKALIDEHFEHIKRALQIIISYKDKSKISLVLNKVDLVKDKEQLLSLTIKLNELTNFANVFMLSALKHKGFEAVLNYLFKSAKIEAWPYDKEQLTDISEREWAAEITREKLYFMLDQELPYSLDVETESYVTNKDKIVIHQVIHVKRDSHKKIILGKNGETIKSVGIKSRKELEYELGQRVDLRLFVRVRA